MNYLYILSLLLSAFEIILILRIILSWFIDVRNPFYNALIVLTEPVLSPVRKLIETSAVSRSLPFDLSPLVVFLIIRLIRSFFRV